MYKIALQKNADYTTNTLKLTFPDGLDVEIININTLLKSQKISNTTSNNEHVTLHIRKSKIFKKHNYKNSKNYAYNITRGFGINGISDGFQYKNLLANFSHLRHTKNCPWIKLWAISLDYHLVHLIELTLIKLVRNTLGN